MNMSHLGVKNTKDMHKKHLYIHFNINFIVFYAEDMHV